MIQQTTAIRVNAFLIERWYEQLSTMKNDIVVQDAVDTATKELKAALKVIKQARARIEPFVKHDDGSKCLQKIADSEVEPRKVTND